MIKGVIFDMDGVLVDNMSVHIQVFADFCRKYGVDTTPDQIARFAGMGNAEIIPRVLPEDVVAKYGALALGEEKERMYREYYADKAVAADGLTAFMDQLRAAGIKIAVGSSALRANVDMVLDNTHIRQYFDTIVDGDMVTRQKPDPDIFLKAAGQLGLSTGECLVVEDSITGIKAAHSAGMKVVALTTTFSAEVLENENPDMIIDSFTELSLDDVRNLWKPD